MALKQRLIDYIRTNLAGESQRTKIDEQTPLLDEGIIDSMGLMQLRMFIEDQVGVRIPDEEVMPDNFESVARIEEMVQRLQAERAAG
jgi:acyl carrier protein